MGQQ
jgi:hypothetical protein